jgi:hypothetical protein
VVAHDESERTQADFSFTDVFVPIHTGPARLLGIIQVNRGEPLEADGAVEFPKGFSNPDFISDVISSGEQVRGVQAHAQAFRLANIFDDASNLFESVTET